MNSDWLLAPTPRKRLRRFWWRHGTNITFALLVLVSVICVFGAMWLNFLIGAGQL